jgi:hypothetical protein
MTTVLGLSRILVFFIAIVGCRACSAARQAIASWNLQGLAKLRGLLDAPTSRSASRALAAKTEYDAGGVDRTLPVKKLTSIVVVDLDLDLDLVLVKPARAGR